MFSFIIHVLVLSSINSLSAGETLTEFHVNESRLQQPRDYPCPDAADIAPCVCSYSSYYDRLTLDCTYISSDKELANILAKEFPVNDFYELTIKSKSYIKALNFTCGGVKFRRFHLYTDYYNGPFPLVEVSDDFYLSCSNSDLEYVGFFGTHLSSLVFPPPPLSDNITDFIMYYSNLTSVPPISSDSLSYLDLAVGQISQIIPGTFDEIPNLEVLYLQGNNITILKNGSIPITYNGHWYSFNSNGLETIEPGAFTLKGEPKLNYMTISFGDNLLKTIDASVFELLMPYIYDLDFHDNPLDCGCDLAWIITNPEYMEKVTRTSHGTQPRCNGGPWLTDLDPTQYEEFC